MGSSRLERIRQCIRLRRYDLTSHAVEEMAEDLLDLVDLEHAIQTGDISHKDTEDPRGTRYVIVGRAADGKTPVGVVGRFVQRDWFLVVTVYEVT